MKSLKIQEREHKQGLKDPQRGAGDHIEHEVAAKQNPRNRRSGRPQKHKKHNEFHGLTSDEIPDEAGSEIDGGGGEREEGGEEEDAGGVAGRERPLVDGEGQWHAFVVDGAGAAYEMLEQADEEKIEEGTEEEGGGKRGGRGEGEEGEEEREPETAIAGDL